MWLPLASPNPSLTHMVCAHPLERNGCFVSLSVTRWILDDLLDLTRALSNACTCAVTLSPASCKETSEIPVPNTILYLILWGGRGRCSCQSYFHQE